MITVDKFEHSMKQDFTDDFLSTDLKRVIIVMPKGVTGKDVEYTEWNGSKAKGNGFLFYNSEDSREQFIKADGGVFIGHEGVCPEGPDGAMISRSMAVKMYLIKHPDAFSSEENIEKTIKYLQDKVFRHSDKDPRKWDGNNGPDMWTSDTKWVEKNFAKDDIYEENGQLKKVISAAKKSEEMVRCEYLGANTPVEGIGDTGKTGSWAVRKSDGTIDLCTDEVFNSSYERRKYRYTY